MCHLFIFDHSKSGRGKKVRKNKKYRKSYILVNFFSVLTTVLFLVLIVVIYLCADVAEDKFGLEADLTGNHFFELSDQSIEFIRNVSENINIAVMMDEYTLEAGGGYFTQAKCILDQYPYYNDKISVEYVDLVKNPAYAYQYPEYTLDYYDILIICGDKVHRTTLTDLFNVEYDSNTGKRYVASSKADQVITSAILRLTSEDAPIISLLTGHGEQYTDEMIDLLKINGYDIIRQNLLTEEINPAVDMIISIAPDRDYEIEMLDKLFDFMRNGKEYGKYFLFAPDTEMLLPNLEAYLLQWGVEVGDSFIIETNPKYILNNTSYMCLVNYTDMKYREKISSQRQVLSPFGRKLNCSFGQRNGYITEVLLEYSEGAMAVPLDTTRSGELPVSNEALYPALIKSSFIQYDGSGEEKSSVLVFAAPGYFEGSILQNDSVANSEFFVALLNEELEKGEGLIVSPKELGGEKLGINQLQLYGMGTLFVIILPFAVMFLGIFVWMSRRNR